MTTDQKNWLPFIALCLVLGAALRLSFPGDIEYKADERYMFEASQAVGVTEPWPDLGMVSGGGLKNPGMSIWIFVGLARLTHATDPVQLARAVQLMNILALVLLAFFALRVVPPGERAPWCWATAFAAVSPAGIVLQRKIWAQSTLPLLCVLLWMAWYHRKTRPGAFFWGLIALCIAQIHMSGFYLAAGLFLWTFYRDRPVHSDRAQWGWWLAGSLAGAIPMLPWVKYVLSNAGQSSGTFKLFWILYPKYWIYWLLDALGPGLSHSLGNGAGLLDFLRYPLIGEVPTYGAGLIHLLMLLGGLRLLYLAKKQGGAKFFRMPEGSATGPLVEALLLGVGGLMTLSCFRIFQHYLIMTFPLEWVWLAWVGTRAPKVGPRYLALLWCLQLLLILVFLGYIHVNHGVPQGDYGTAYQYQTP
ncbi:MAG TPA: hypothetical protein VHE12_12555 [bacterium]|nr:hypothetical protein [bacterium]